MSTRKTPGLWLKAGYWHIDKKVRGVRIQGSTGCRQGELREAEAMLAKKIEEVRQARVFGVRPRKLWRDAATKYLTEHAVQLRSADDVALHLEQLDGFIGELYVDQVSTATLEAFVEHERVRGLAPKSINNALGVVRRILNLAASEWTDPLSGQTWIVASPKLRFERLKGHQRPPYPLSWDEQSRLLQALAPHLERMALFGLNTGCREAEICGLRWNWEVQVPELRTSVFVIPEEVAKSGTERIVVLNTIARSVIEARCGEHRERVFTYHPAGKPSAPVGKMNNTSWKRARRETGIPVRVHDLRHTFTRRLRAAGVSNETRKALLGHAHGDITTHYSAAELAELIAAVELIAVRPTRESPALTLLKRRALS